MQNFANVKPKGKSISIPTKKKYIIADSDYTCSSCEFDYAGKVSSFFEKLVANFDLDLKPIKIRDNNGAEQWKLVPKKNWNVSAKALIEVINGYGSFHFSSVSDGMRSGPYISAKDFFFAHIGWMTSYFEVYEGSKIKGVFERFAFGR